MVGLKKLICMTVILSAYNIGLFGANAIAAWATGSVMVNIWDLGPPSTFAKYSYRFPGISLGETRNFPRVNQGKEYEYSIN